MSDQKTGTRPPAGTWYASEIDVLWSSEPRYYPTVRMRDGADLCCDGVLFETGEACEEYMRGQGLWVIDWSPAEQHPSHGAPWPAPDQPRQQPPTPVAQQATEADLAALLRRSVPEGATLGPISYERLPDGTMRASLSGVQDT